MVHYLDTSAAVKLVVAEAETPELIAWADRHRDEIVSSDLTRTELIRAVRRAQPDRIRQARVLLESIDLIALPAAVFERAATLDPVPLRSLDALHLAAAMEFGDELDSLVTYDDRLASAAESHGIAVVAPGAD